MASDTASMSLGRRWVVGLRHESVAQMHEGHISVRITLNSGESFLIAWAGWEPDHLAELGWVNFGVYPDSDEDMLEDREGMPRTPTTISVHVSTISKVEFLRTPPDRREVGFRVPDEGASRTTSK
jgi:hypothetical protein